MPEKTLGIGGINIRPERLRALRPDVVTQLAESIAARGLINPITVRPRESGGYWLIAGRHRLAAAKKLKLETIRASILEGLQANEAELIEIDENLIRAELDDAEEAMHLYRRKELYEELHPETKHGATLKRGSKKAPKSQNETSAFINDTAKKTGKSRATVARKTRRGEQGREWLEDVAGTCLAKKAEIDALIELPAKERNDLIADAKAGKKVKATTVLKQWRRGKRENALGRKQRALPDKKYGVIVSDCEWDDVTWSEHGKMKAPPYSTSAKEVIKSRPVAKIAADDCVLFHWTTNQHLRIAIEVLETWGFTYKSHYVWAKDKISTGRWNRSKHEILLIGICGEPPCPAPGKQKDSLIQASCKGLKHSQKPEVFMQMIEEYYPTLPKIELNCRGKPRPGWDGWGLETEQPAEAADRSQPRERQPDAAE